jgi:MFS family permease
VADSLAVVIVGRVMQAAGAGMYPLAYGIIRDELPRERVATGIGLMSATLGIGTGIGSVAGGVIADYVTYRWIFGVIAILAALGAVATWRVVPESPVRAPARIDWWGAALFSAGLTAPLLAISQASVWGWGSGKTLGLLAAGLVVLAFWRAFERRVANPLVDMRMLGSRTSIAANGAALFVGFGSLGGFLLFPLLAQQPRSGVGFAWGATAAAALLVPQGVMQMLTGRFGGSLGYRFGNRLPLLLGTFVFGALPLAVLPFFEYRPWLLFVVSGLAGIGAGLSWAAIPNLTLEGVPPEQTSIATGLNTITTVAGGAVAAQVAIAILNAHAVGAVFGKAGFDIAFAACAGAFVAAAALAASAPTRVRSAEPVTPRPATS